MSESNRHLLLLKAMVLNKEQANKYKDILAHHKDVSDYEYTIEEYYHDCNDRKMNVCSSVVFENNRITAQYTAGARDELVFFSIPYEPGWSAEVNGNPVEIEKVSVGFMAVRVPKGQTSEIVFRFRTYGLTLGIGLTSAGIVITIVYMLLWKAPVRRKSVIMSYYEDDEGFVPSDYDDVLFEEYEEGFEMASHSYAKSAEQTETPPEESTAPVKEEAPESTAQPNNRQKVDIAP